MAQITKEQYQELKNAELCDYEEFMRLLKEYTGIEVRLCSYYEFYDDAGDYVGNGSHDVDELLQAAYVEVK